MRLDTPKKRLFALMALIALVIMIVLAVVSVSRPTPDNTTTGPSLISTVRRSNDELVQAIVATYPGLKASEFIVDDVFYLAPHWYVVTATSPASPAPIKYMIYDGRPSADKLIIIVTGGVYKEFPDASHIPQTILDKTLDTGE